MLLRTVSTDLSTFRIVLLPIYVGVRRARADLFHSDEKKWSEPVTSRSIRSGKSVLYRCFLDLAHYENQGVAS